MNWEAYFVLLYKIIGKNDDYFVLQLEYNQCVLLHDICMSYGSDL